MATIYKVKVVSHWMSYSKEELENLFMQVIEKEREKGNSLQVIVEDRK